MLQHLLAVDSEITGEDVILLAEEQLETLQALLEAADPGQNWRPPLTRHGRETKAIGATVPDEEETHQREPLRLRERLAAHGRLGWGTRSPTGSSIYPEAETWGRGRTPHSRQRRRLVCYRGVIETNRQE